MKNKNGELWVESRLTLFNIFSTYFPFLTFQNDSILVKIYENLKNWQKFSKDFDYFKKYFNCSFLLGLGNSKKGAIVVSPIGFDDTSLNPADIATI